MYQQKKKMNPKKMIEIGILIFIAIWLVVFGINYVRYTESKPLILALHLTHKEDDGVTEEYVALGYVYRQYKRNSITREEFVPFWVPMERPESLPDLPVVETGYEVPENHRMLDKFRGLLYYYDENLDFVGTYKCINSNGYCNKAFSGHDSHKLLQKDPTTFNTPQKTLGKIYDKFAFVDDSAPQDIKYGDPAYSRIIYLYRFRNEEYDEDGNKPEILAKFADVKHLKLEEYTELGTGDDYKYIVKSMDNHLWGLIKIKNSGKIEQVLPYEYESMTYDIDTGYYILCKNKKWFVYDLEKEKVVSVESDNPIYDVWQNANRTEYIKVGVDRTIGNEELVDFKVYRIDGKSLLDGDMITAIYPRGKFIFYVTAKDNYLRFMDYGKTELYKLKLNFWQLKHNELTQPAFEIYNESDSFMILRVYDKRDLSYNYETIGINLVYWENND